MLKTIASSGHYKNDQDWSLGGSMHIRNVLLAALCASLAVAASSSFAQQSQKGAKAGGERVCQEDAKKFCSNVRPGAGRIYSCLTSHNAELAPACRERLAAAKARYDEFVNACKSDAEKYCKGIPPGAGRILSCLKGRESDLTAGCKAQFHRAGADTTVTQ
ncbi:MAG TPA: cysteine rich repeat-containing protein [Burkholderiales bacterium]|nr:cysteine rich repeat-containing protein [Burkholderiales bacterium]